MTNPCRNAASVRLPDLSFVRLPACATHVYAPVALRTERPRHVACRTPQPSPRPQTASAFGSACAASGPSLLALALLDVTMVVTMLAMGSPVFLGLAR